jgi:hypothetical protein
MPQRFLLIVKKIKINILISMFYISIKSHYLFKLNTATTGQWSDKNQLSRLL